MIKRDWSNINTSFGWFSLFFRSTEEVIALFISIAFVGDAVKGTIKSKSMWGLSTRSIHLSTGSVQRDETPQLWFVIGNVAQIYISIMVSTEEQAWNQTGPPVLGENTQAYKANIIESFTSFYTRVCCKIGWAYGDFFIYFFFLSS